MLYNFQKNLNMNKTQERFLFCYFASIEKFSAGENIIIDEDALIKCIPGTLTL